MDVINGWPLTGIKIYAVMGTTIAVFTAVMGNELAILEQKAQKHNVKSVSIYNDMILNNVQDSNLALYKYDIQTTDWS